MNGDLKTDGRDLSILLANFGCSALAPEPDPHQAEFDEWLLEMGLEPGPDIWPVLRTRGDLNADNKIDGFDLNIVLGNLQCSEVP